MSYRAVQDSVPYSETLARVSSDAERLFWRMVAISDRWGCGYGEPAKLGAATVPLLGWTPALIDGAVRELVLVGRVVVYIADGRTYFHLVDFDDHQPRALIASRGSRRFPAPPDEAVKAARVRSHKIRAAAHTEKRRGESLEGSLSSEDPARARSADEELPFQNTQTDNGAIPERFRKLAAMATDADATSARVWAIHAEGLPESAIGRVEEALRERLNAGGLRSPAGFVTACFKREQDVRKALA